MAVRGSKRFRAFEFRIPSQALGELGKDELKDR
jgi:hypothetical protein